jgi:adenosine deaminase
MGDRSAVLDGIKDHQPLQHVETVDKAAPKIEADVHVGKSPMPDLIKEVTTGKPALQHVETVGGEPKIEADVHIGKSTRPQLMQEIAEAKKE